MSHICYRYGSQIISIICLRVSFQNFIYGWSPEAKCLHLRYSVLYTKSSIHKISASKTYAWKLESTISYTLKFMWKYGLKTLFNHTNWIWYVNTNFSDFFSGPWWVNFRVKRRTWCKSKTHVAKCFITELNQWSR